MSFAEDLAAAVKNVEWRTATITFMGKPYNVKAKPVTPADTAAMNKRFPGSETNPTLAAMCFMMIQKVYDADTGKKLFQQHDYESLILLPAKDLVLPLAENLFGETFDMRGDQPTEEELTQLTKNSESGQTS